MRRFLLLAALVAAPAAAQELRCTQIFMNASEKRICATPELMEQDATMGRLARRAETVMPDYRREQKAFRQALKRCDGETSCLAQLYTSRIDALNTAVGSMPEPDAEQAKEWAADDAKADLKRQDQAARREAYAAELQEKDAKAQATSAPTVQAEMVKADPAPAEPDASVEPEQVNEEPAAPAPSPAAPPLPAKDSEPGWGTYAFMIAIALGVWLAFWSWLTTACRRCPRCKKWFGGNVYDYDQSSHTDYETKTFRDVHRDRNNMPIKTVERQQQVKVRVVQTTDHLKCKVCNHLWSTTSTVRSS